MKSKIKNYRLYCKCCEDFTIFNTDICIDCNTEYNTIFIKDIPLDKLNIQRKRFKKQRSENFENVMNIYSTLGNLSSANYHIGYKVIETDAGLVEEEKEIRKEKEELKNYRLSQLSLFNKIGRNDDCLCGSNKKYKKCCLIIHETW